MRKLFTFCLALIASASLAFGAVPEDQLTFISRQDGSSVGLAKLSSHQTIEYSLDGNTWKSMTTETTFSLNKDVALYVRGKLSADNSQEADYTQFAITGSVEAKGNINYLWNYENLNAPLKKYCGAFLFVKCTGLTSMPDLPATTLARGCYLYMFARCTALTTAPELPAKKCAPSCYRAMFQGCTSLITAPGLPATTLADNCYKDMFVGCNSLVNIPAELPALSLDSSCYRAMFLNCSSLKTTPKLPATKCAAYCYYDMFNGCKELTTALELPATTLANNCYINMFSGCKSLTTAPELPATTLANKCYNNMFAYCTSLTTAPELPATELSYDCYRNMFRNCTSLTTAPELPATTLAEGCYFSMFEGCSALTNAPKLPAKSLARKCYHRMFKNCTELTKAPVLPALSLVDSCYGYMFEGCEKINYIKCLAENVNASWMAQWVNGVAATGTFVANAKATWATGTSGIPSGWTKQTVTPFTINFDANGGQIPTNGNIGIAPENQISYLSPDQLTGYVIVNTGETAFNKLNNDNPTRAGHTFLGWYTAKSGGVQVYDNLGLSVAGDYWDSNGKWQGTADLQLYAQWSVNSYTITWLQDDGSLIDKTTVPYGQIPTHVIPTKEPTAEYTYTFAGWAPEVVEVTDNATYIATYTAHSKTEGIDDVQSGEEQCTKVVRNGQIFILRGEKTYTVTGQEVK